MATSSPALRAALLAALAGGAGFAAGRLTGGTAASPEQAPEPPSAPWKFVTGDASAPSWAVTGKWEMPTAGSIFRNRFAMPGWPLEGVESLVVTSREETCPDECPLGMRIVSGDGGWATLHKLLPSLAPNLKAVEQAAGVPPQLAVMLRQGRVGLASRGEVRETEEGQAPLRALFIAMPRPDVAPDAWSVGLSLHDLPDPHFDRAQILKGMKGGQRLLISRVERPGEAGGRPRLVCGAVEISRSLAGTAPRPIPESATELGRAFGSLWGHFSGLPEEIVGIYLAENGRAYAYGPNLELKLLPESPELKRALEALFRRA